MIRIRFFARLREALGCDVLDLCPPSRSPLSVAGLRRHLIHEYPHWAAHLDSRLLSAVNQDMANGQTPVRDGDEVAFFPPVTGG